ncbi:hypothetical protein E2C01_065957 [Portunus trituberculatus]|uniref:Uncharacterized protein n=1 Tax=Portunus trituberculatus TaxID=210409 RepID=A0A5B7HK87_PORTR|nr:hypothetical protein [Portunus trituberculatus]
MRSGDFYNYTFYQHFPLSPPPPLPPFSCSSSSSFSIRVLFSIIPRLTTLVIFAHLRSHIEKYNEYRFVVVNWLLTASPRLVNGSPAISRPYLTSIPCLPTATSPPPTNIQ